MIQRIGMGMDVHRFDRPVEACMLRLGGVDVPFDRPLVAHSDGDVLLHALMDALLGAAGLGDIGEHFPDTEEEYAGANSLELLGRTLQLVKAAGYRVGNVDMTLMGEAPKIGPYKAAIRDAVSKALELDAALVNVKGTTTEHLGFIGRGEGLAAQAVCLLEKSEADAAPHCTR